VQLLLPHSKHEATDYQQAGYLILLCGTEKFTQAFIDKTMARCLLQLPCSNPCTYPTQIPTRTTHPHPSTNENWRYRDSTSLW